jgi:hypothetical protein
MAPVRRRTTALLVVAAVLLAAVTGLAWFLVGADDPSGEATAGGPTTLDPAAGPAEADPTTPPGPTTASGADPTASSAEAGASQGTTGPPAPPAPACAGVLSGAEAATALGTAVARVETRDGFLMRTCTFWSSGDRYLLVQVNRGVTASRDQYELSRLPGDRNVAGIGQAARWTRDTGLLDVLDGPARFQVGLFTPAAGPAATEPPARLEAAARAVAAHL